MEKQKHELWDLYDEKRNKLNKTMWRDEASRKLKQNSNEFHIVVNVYVIDGKGNILITKRHPDKNYGGLWEVTGGSIIAGEDSLLGVQRELEEEIGIKANREDFILLHSYINYSSCSIYDIYALILREICLNDLKLQAEEVVDAKVVSIDEFNKIVEDDMFFNKPDAIRYKRIEGELAKYVYINSK